MKTLSPNALQNEASFERRSFFAVVPHDVTIDDVLAPRFWAHHVARLPIHSIVEVVSVDGQFDLEMRVVSSGIGFVKMRVLRRWERTELPKADKVPEVTMDDLPEGYEVSFAPKKMWRAFIKDPLQEIRSGLASREHAIAAAIEHARLAEIAA